MNLKRAFRRCAAQVGPGGFARQMTRHCAIYAPRGRTLVVTFDNMKSREAKGARTPWGWDLVQRMGHSHLGICMTRRNDWFRHVDLLDFFDELRDTGFFTGFDEVIFYGSSMGGFGALAFAAAAPGARIVAHVPQTSLRPDLVPFERRYRPGQARGDWDDPRYADGAEGARLARSVTVFYDPLHRLDRQHVARLPQANLMAMRCPFMGHRVPRLLQQLGILRPVVERAFNGTLRQAHFSTLLGRRKTNLGYVRTLLDQGLERGHLRLVASAMDRIEQRPGVTMPKYRRIVTQKLAA